MKKTAAAYIRVSDERQDEFSPDSQLKLIRDYCARNNIELPDELIFYDDGISAKSVKKRQQFNDMIAIAKQKEKPFQMILVWKFSRFARNQEESIVYKSLLRKNGVDVISVSEPIQDNPFGGLIERIIEWMDEYYLIRLSDEVRRGMTERATRGLPNTAPPFGYDMKDGQYIVNEEQAAVVQQVFELFAEDPNLHHIARYLNSLGLRNKYGNPFDNRGLEYMLNNPVYIGYVRWNPNGRSASIRNYNNPEDILKKSNHTPIVSNEIFEKVKTIFENRKQTRQKYQRDNFQKNVFMLKGLVKCNTCGSTLVFSKNGLQCHKYAHGTCEVSHYVSLKVIDKMVIEELNRAVDNLSFDIHTAKKKVSSTPQVDYDSLISTERLKLDRAKQAYQAGVDSLEEYKATKTKIDANIKKLQKEKRSTAMEEAEIDINAFAATVSDVLTILESPDTPEELKNKALKSIVRKIIFHKPEKRIEIFFYI